MRLNVLQGGLLLLLVAGMAACSGSAPAVRQYAGLSTSFEPGIPAFDAQARPALEGGQRGIRVDVRTPEIALVFRRNEGALTARVEWLVRLLDETGNQVLVERSGRNTILKGTDRGPSLFRTASYSAFLPVSAGDYVIEIVLEDLTSGKTERRMLAIELPARNQPLVVTELLLETVAGSPVVGIQVPDTIGVLKSVFYLTGNITRPVRIHTLLVRLDVDTTTALPPFWTGPISGSLRMNIEVSDTLYSNVRTESRGPLSRIEEIFPLVDSGIYRVEVEIEDLYTEGSPPAVELTRYIIFRSSNFPAVSEFSGLIPPLIYLAEAGEWDELRSSIGTDDARGRFDGFWGRYMSDRQRASEAVRTYFSRVEGANLRYSDFKEGWKTDRGMIYILMGEPLFIERTLDAEIWYYAYDDGRGERTFRFNRALMSDTPEVIKHFLLERRSEYERFWRRTTERWRRGETP